MIMAAGLGTRMRPLTETLPKPLVKVRGRALIDHVIDRLVAAGVTLIVVNTHYKAEQIKAHLAARKDVEIRISDESDALLDSGGGILKALPNFEGEAFYHANADTVWSEGASSALEKLSARWDENAMDALMLLAPTVSTVCYEGRGDFMMDSDGILSRVPEGRISPFVWMSIEIVHPRLFDGVKPGKFSINPLWDKAIAKGRLYGQRLDGVWMHIDRPDAVKESEAFLADLAPA
jgi:N-acetyl-alpha-D-muramate 1-phosphate uridylyltransferase